MHKKARYLTGIIGFATIAWGYSMHIYPLNILLEAIGAIALLIAIFNPFSIFGGSPVTSDIVTNDGKEYNPHGSDSRAETKTNSTTQCGSNQWAGFFNFGRRRL